jgi:uncharacterized protein
MNKHYPTYKQSIWLLLAIIPILAIFIMPLVIFHNVEDNFLLTILSEISLGILIWIGLSKRKNFSFSKTLFPLSSLLAAYIFLFSFHFVAEPLTNLLPQPEGLEEVLNDLLPYPIFLFLMLVIVGPVLEELLFRGIITDGYLKNYSPFMSALVSAILFAVFHGNLAQGIGALVMGIVVGLIYWRTGSLLFCIALHMLNNFTAYLAMLLLDSVKLEFTIRQLIDNDTVYFSSYAIVCIILIYSGWYLWRTYVKPAREQLFAKPIDVNSELPSEESVGQAEMPTT